MGVDCKINLPDNVRIQDVAYVIGIAAGLKVDWEQCSHDPEHQWLRVQGVEVKRTDIITMAEILISSTGGLLIDGETHHYVYYHLESSYGGRSLSPRSTAFWIAIAHRLVDFFGGAIDYHDCDDVDVNYKRMKKPRRLNCPEDGDDYWNFYQRISKVKPITKEDLIQYDEVAAYKISERR